MPPHAVDMRRGKETVPSACAPSRLPVLSGIRLRRALPGSPKAGLNSQTDQRQGSRIIHFLSPKGVLLSAVPAGTLPPDPLSLQAICEKERMMVWRVSLLFHHIPPRKNIIQS